MQYKNEHYASTRAHSTNSGYPLANGVLPQT
jgi:hypothetical protein